MSISAITVETDNPNTTAILYEQDFYSWTQRQAMILRSGRLDTLDIHNVLEEIEALGRAERSALKSAYRLVCSHLLKMKYQSSRYTRRWYNTVDRERGEIIEILSDNPGLRPHRSETFAAAYALGRKDAARETRLPLQAFPVEPPFTIEECESTRYVPSELRDHLGSPENQTGNRHPQPRHGRRIKPALR